MRLRKEVWIVKRTRKTYTSPAVKARWNKQNYDRIAVLVPKEHEEIIRKYAEENNLSLNGLINELFRREMMMSEMEWNPKITCERCTLGN